jgi:hypothetical protein
MSHREAAATDRVVRVRDFLCLSIQAPSLVVRNSSFVFSVVYEVLPCVDLPSWRGNRRGAVQICDDMIEGGKFVKSSARIRLVDNSHSALSPASLTWLLATSRTPQVYL